MTIIIFKIENKLYGLNSADVIEVIPMLELNETVDPESRYHAVFNLRGNIIPVIKLRKKLGYPDLPNKIWNKIIITEIRSKKYGIIVDNIKDVVTLDEKSFLQENDKPHNLHSNIIQWENSLITMLNLKKTINGSTKRQYMEEA